MTEPVPVKLARDTLLLSHASPEDNEFTLWLTLQLANEGYRVCTERTVKISKSDGIAVAGAEEIEESVNARRSDLRNGLTSRQRIFLLEKLVGVNDKDAAGRFEYFKAHSGW